MNIRSKTLLLANKKYTLNVSTTPSNAICTLTYKGNTYTAKSVSVPKGTVVSYSVSYSGYITQTGSWTITSDENKYITLSPAQYTLTIITNPDSASCTLTYGGNSYSAKTATVTNGTTIDYSVSSNGTPNYGTQTGSITMDSNKTLTFTGTYSSTIVDNPWSQPYLTSGNGTMGGSSFAVAGTKYNNYDVYKMFDEGISTWVAEVSNAYFIFYNPIPLKVTNLKFTNGSTGNYPFAEGTVSGSDTKSNWVLIKSFTNSTGGSLTTWDVSLSTNTNYYKYYMVVVTKSIGNGSLAQASNLAITATTGTTSYTYYWEVT